MKPTNIKPKVGDVYHFISDTIEEIMEITSVTKYRFTGTTLCIIKQFANRKMNGKDWNQRIQHMNENGTCTYTKIKKQDHYWEYLL